MTRMRTNTTNCFLHQKIRAIRVIRGRIPGKMSQNTAGFGRKWQDLLENGRTVQFGTGTNFPVFDKQTSYEKCGAKYTSASQTPILAVGVFKYLPLYAEKDYGTAVSPTAVNRESEESRGW